MTLLLEAPGIDVNRAAGMKYEGMTPLVVARIEGFSEVVALLEAAGAQANYTLHSATNEGNAGEVARLLGAPWIDVNRVDWKGNTPLTCASAFDHTEVVKVLLAAPGIDVNRANEDGRTPLHWASQEGHSAVVKLLLAAPGIDVNRADKDGITPLYAASKNGLAEVVELLLEAPGMDVNLADKAGETPLFGASHEGHLEVVKLLLRAPGTDVFKTGEDGKTALEMATDPLVISALERVVVKRTCGGLLLALMHRGVDRDHAAGLAIHGLPSEHYKDIARSMRKW